MKSKVFIYQTRIPKYREAFFQQLIALGDGDNVDYKIIVSKDRFSVYRHESTMNSGVQSVTVKRIKILGREIHIHKSLNLHKNANLVICEYGLKNILVYYLLFVERRQKFAFWGHGQTSTRDTFSIERKLQRRLLSRANYFFAYTQSCLNFLASIDYPPTRIQVLNNSVDTKSLRSSESIISKDRAKLIINNLGLTSQDFIFLYIGSLEEDKRIKFLLDAFGILVGIKPNVALLICSQDNFEFAVSKNFPPRTYFIGEADASLKIGLSKFSRGLLNPGRVGLIAVDSFALGLPIITTQWHRHAPEFSYLENDVNSIIAENNLTSYVDACVKLLTDDTFRERLIDGCIESSKHYTVEKMASNFHSGVLKCLAM